jgi:hypothetical protein
VPALIRLRKGVGKVNDAVIESRQRLMPRIAARTQVDGMRNIARGKQMAYEL